MRVLFSSTPSYGHLLPLLPLARALRSRGHEVAVLSAEAMSPLLAPEGIELLPAGPDMDVVLAETGRRTGTDRTQPVPARVAELFGRVRIDLGADEALLISQKWQPDLVVSESGDFVGPLVASALDLRLARLAFGPAFPPEFTDALAEAVAERFAARGLTLRPADWLLDTCPPAMQLAGWRPEPGTLALRPEAHRQPCQDSSSTDEPVRRAPSGRRRVLVSFGTIFTAPEMLGPILRELSLADLDLVATVGLEKSAQDYGVDQDRVTFVGFTALDQLLRDIDLVVTHGGAGTTFGALAAGIPLVVIPQGADQFLQADRVVAAGAGLAVLPNTAKPQAVAEAVAAVLGDPSFRAAARVVAAEIAARPTPDEVAARLETELVMTRVSADSRTS